jgi:hypothetical protein
MALDLPLQRGAHTGNLRECQMFSVGNQGNVLHNSGIVHYYPPDVWEMPRCVNHLPVTDPKSENAWIANFRDNCTNDGAGKSMRFDRHKCCCSGKAFWTKTIVRFNSTARC